MKTDSRIKLYPYDRLFIGYCLMMTLLILLVGRPLERYVTALLFYPSMLAVIRLVVYYARDEHSRLQSFFRVLYPAIMFTFFYTTAGDTVFLLFDGFFDWQLTTFEKIILGVNPTLYIDRHLLNVWVTEILSCCYFSYYLMLPAFLLPLFMKKDYEVIRRCLTACSLAFFISYILFFLYPVEGPRWFFAGEYLHAVEGPVFRPMVDMVIDGAAFHGGCMPSSHVAVGLVILMFAFKYYRRAGWILLPFNIGLALGTFWGRFHYVSDVVVGAAIGLFSTLFVWKYYDRWTTFKNEKTYQKELIEENVS